MHTGNHLVDGDNGSHPFSPYYTGKEITPTKRCDVCEYEHDESNTVTLKECGTTYCTGCAKNLDIQDVFCDHTPDELRSIINQLKPIL